MCVHICLYNNNSKVKQAINLKVRDIERFEGRVTEVSGGDKWPIM